MTTIFLILSAVFFPLASYADQTLWKTSCYQIDDDVLSEKILMTDGNWNHTFIAYEETGCKVPYLKFEQTYKSKVSALNEVDLTHVESSYTPLSADTAEAMALISWCGVHNWKVNIKSVVTGNDCGDFKPQSEGDMTYTIILPSVDKSSFFLGRPTPGYDGKTSESRHRELNLRPFQKADLVP